MTRRGIRFALLAALLVVFAPGTTIAQTGTIVDWGPDSYATESSYNAATFISNPGSLLNVYGIVNDFAGPMAALEPVPPGTEYTYVLTNLRSAGTGITPGGFANTYRTVYNTTNPALNNFSLYRSPTNADFASPGTFSDGILVLSGRFQSLTVTFARRNSDSVVLGGNADTGNPSVANGVFTGGSEYGRVSVNGVGCPFRVTGAWLARPGNFPTGYTAHFDGKLDIDCPTPATSATWGRIKGQYR